jgi:hypothetical protein
MNLTFYVIINKGLEFGRDIEVGAGFRSKSKKKPDHKVRLFYLGHL